MILRNEHALHCVLYVEFSNYLKQIEASWNFHKIYDLQTSFKHNQVKNHLSPCNLVQLYENSNHVWRETR